MANGDHYQSNQPRQAPGSAHNRSVTSQSDASTSSQHTGGARSKTRHRDMGPSHHGSQASLASSRPDATASGYAPHPLRYATYEGGLHNLDASRSSDVIITPQQTQSARRAPATVKQNEERNAHGRSAFTDVTKQKMSSRQPPPSAFAPKRLDFTPDSHTPLTAPAASGHVSFDQSFTNQQDTMI